MKAALLVLAAFVLVLSACSSGGNGQRSTPTIAAPAVSPSAMATAATETGSPGVGETPTVRFEPAFPKLTPAARPTALVEVPGQDWMLLAVQDGRILGFPNDASASEYTTVWDNRANTSRDGNEEGLLGLALDPDFASNGYLYVYYSAASGERRTVLSRLSTSGSGTSLRVNDGSELVILEQPQPYSNHKGGQLAFGPDGMLYVGLGDGGSGGDPMGNGQDITRNWLGSILRIDVRDATAAKPYTIPADNPFASGEEGARPETWAYGLRNPWRFSFDSATGTPWIADVGQSNWEEVDIGEPGANYGWNVMEGFHCYQPSNGCDEDGLTLPVTEYSHADGACSITGGFVYRGDAIPALRGYYVYADYCSGIVQAFTVDGADAGSKPTVATLRPSGPEVSSFAQDLSGELYVLDFDGTIERIVP